MRIKSSIFICTLLFHLGSNAQQNKTEYCIASKVLFAVVDDIIFNKHFELDDIQKLDFKMFKVYNSYKNEYLSADSIRIMYVTPFDVSRKTFNGQEIGKLEGLKKNIKYVEKGDVIAIMSTISISGIRYRIGFSCAINNKDEKEKLFFIPAEDSWLEEIK